MCSCVLPAGGLRGQTGQQAASAAPQDSTAPAATSCSHERQPGSACLQGLPTTATGTAQWSPYLAEAHSPTSMGLATTKGQQLLQPTAHPLLLMKRLTCQVWLTPPTAGATACHSTHTAAAASTPVTTWDSPTRELGILIRCVNPPIYMSTLYIPQFPAPQVVRFQHPCAVMCTQCCNFTKLPQASQLAQNSSRHMMTKEPSISSSLDRNACGSKDATRQRGR